MTDEQVIAMAKEAGFTSLGRESWDCFDANIVRFAKLVAKAEREACAQVCDDLARQVSNDNFIAFDNRKICAASIRARKDL